MSEVTCLPPNARARSENREEVIEKDELVLDLPRASPAECLISQFTNLSRR